MLHSTYSVLEIKRFCLVRLKIRYFFFERSYFSYSKYTQKEAETNVEGCETKVIVTFVSHPFLYASQLIFKDIFVL